MKLTTACIISALCVFKVAAQEDISELPLRISHGTKLVQVQRTILKQISREQLVPARKVEVCIVGERECSNIVRKRLREGRLNIQVGLPTDTREYERSGRIEEITSIRPVRVRVSSQGCVAAEFVVAGPDESASLKLVLNCAKG